MSAHEILIAVMAVFAVLGALDRIIGNRFGIGKEFENGIMAMGSLAMAMIGIIALAPVLADILTPVVVPVYRFLGADPAMFAGTILACDMGGGSLAMEMSSDPQAALLGGVLTGSMLGATIVFTIPIAMGILEETDRAAMAKGILCGIVTIPGSGVLHFHAPLESAAHCADCGTDRPGSLESGKGNDQRVLSFRKGCHYSDHRGVGVCYRSGVDGFCDHPRHGGYRGRLFDGGRYRHCAGRRISLGARADKAAAQAPNEAGKKLGQ